ncbi:hypothetical protein GH714_034301 [Hevea brasiliensis]|uniref:Uncharacterized protein n=1 Tax=Hevea brasiliensis TaxID=3981 RepID=A0A6A6MEY3_HEVBR|nr:hypothetical protein GH714_034301 [Hevea brasiliensis]
MIAAVSWVPKGVSKSVPAVADPPSKEEIEQIIKAGALERREADDEDMDVDTAKQTDEATHALAVAEALGRTPKNNNSATKFDDIADGLKELDMERYDDEDEGVELFSTGLGDLYYPSNDMDPYLKDKDDDDSEELEDMTIKPKDAVIVCARNEDEFSHLEVWILEESDDGDSNMYVHHDIVLSAFPLCTAWLDCPLKEEEKGNFIAVGSMDPSIEIWDLNIIDEVQPSVVLGGIVEKKKKKKKGNKTLTNYKEGSHTDSVLGLAWNKQFRNIIASASADRQVKIWDVATGKCDITLEHHTDKTSGYFDTVFSDVGYKFFLHATPYRRMGGFPHPGFRWSVTADVESLAWDPHSNHSFVVSLEDGTVQGFDIRAVKSDSSSDSKPSFTLHAHDSAVCTVSYNPFVPSLLATGSTDKMVKLWDLSNNQPSCVASKNPKAGAVFSISFSEDSPFLLAVGGSKGKLEVWDTLSDAGVSKRFGNYSNQNGPHLGT